MKRGCRQQCEHGFTLIELLVGLVLLGMLAAMVLAGVNSAGRFAQRSNQSLSDADAVGAAQMILRARIERFRAVTRLDSSTALVDARGAERDFAFFATPADSESPDGLLRYRLILSATGDLVLYRANGLDDRIDLNARNLIGWQQRVLLRNVGSMSINYFGPAQISRGRLWQTLWNDRAQPPELIRIRIAFAPGDTRRWPDLVVRPRTTVNSACRIDALSGRCADEV